MRLFVFLHVLSMFAAVAVSGGGDLLFRRIALTRDAAAIRTAGATFGALARVIPILFLVGLGFGVVAIFANGFNPFAPWLLFAYPLFVAGLLVGNFVTGAWVGRVTAAASASDWSSAELDARVAERGALTGMVAFWLIVAAIIFVMVVKPLS
jgi:hypothetical protein